MRHICGDIVCADIDGTVSILNILVPVGLDREAMEDGEESAHDEPYYTGNHEDDDRYTDGGKPK